MLLEIFTDILCSKPAPPSLGILWCKALFFKTWIPVVFTTVFLKKKLKTLNFQFFFSFWAPKMLHFFQSGSKVIPNEWDIWFKARSYISAVTKKLCENEEKIIIENLKSQITLYNTENKFPKEEMKSKQNILHEIFHQNGKFLKFDHYFNELTNKKENIREDKDT